MGVEKTLDVLQVPRSMRNRFHDQQVFDPWQPDVHPTHGVSSPLRDGLLFEWQAAENYVDVNRRVPMPQQEHARTTSKGYGVVNPWHDTVGSSCTNRRFPLGLREDGQDIDILRESRTA